jgi:jumonji domain-containing protein 7
MGDGRAVTSTHKDPYENVYCVVRGSKDVTLFPPTDLPWLTYQRCGQAKYARTSTGAFAIEHLTDAPKVPWIAVDPLNPGESPPPSPENARSAPGRFDLPRSLPDFAKYPEFRNASPVKVKVNAGDALYLPSFWFHHLRQSHGCIAVNFWYDMDHDVKWNYFQFLTDLVRLNRSTRKSTHQ